METTHEQRQHERRTERKLIDFQDRRIGEWRRAADRAEREGKPVTASMFRNEAYFLELERAQ
jgi:hypothetical protein